MDYSYNPTDEQFRQWYKNTAYKVFEPSVSFRIGSVSRQLNQLLSRLQHDRFVFITAWNPAPKVFTQKENQDRQFVLRTRLSAKGYIILDGVGVGDDKNWPPEESLFVAGLTKSDGLNIAREFGQKAIVYGELGLAPLLVFC